MGTQADICFHEEQGKMLAHKLLPIGECAAIPHPGEVCLRLALPVEKRMNFLRVRLPGGGSAL
jgi:hypothetical protein